MGKEKKDRLAGGQPREQVALATTGDSPWATYQRSSRVTSRTLILTGGPIFDPDDVARHPEQYLLDIYAHEAEATRIWMDRRRRDNSWSEGVVMLRYQETELMPAGAVDDVCALWGSLLRLIEQFQHTGRAETSFFTSPTPRGRETINRRVLFSVAHGPRTMGEPVPFMPRLAEEAERFFHWTGQHLR